MGDLPALEGGTPVRSSFLPFGEPSITEDEINEVVATLRSGWIGTGAKTTAFEAQFAGFVHANNAVAVNSCTAALHLSLLAAGCGPGDDVVIPDLTFAATANAVVHCGARPVLAEVDPKTFNVTRDTVASAVTPNTRAVVPVHFGGLACDLEGIYGLATERGLAVVEDCAHAVGAEYRRKMIGSFPGLSCFSFYANKNLTTGEGGMIATPDADIAAKISSWRLHGLDRDAWKRFHTREVMLSSCVYPGFKYNLTDVAASLGLHQLRRLPEMLATRERHAERLDATLREIPGLTMQYRPNDRDEGRHGLHLYAAVMDPEAFRIERNELVAALRAENIGAAIHYEPIHRQPYYAQLLGLDDAALPHAARIGGSIISLPAQASMTDTDVDDVVTALTRVCDFYRS